MLKNEDIKLLYEVNLFLVQDSDNKEGQKLSGELKNLIDRQNSLHVQARENAHKNKKKQQKKKE